MADHHQINLSLFLVLFSCFSCFTYGYQFVVGGSGGWVVNPSENYNHWAERMRFQVNDTLLFKYDKALDSVLVVTRDDYDGCSTGNPIQRLDDGNSTFKFDRSGPFYFISGNQTNCNNGQKLFIIVMAVRNRPITPAPTVAPPQGASSPSPAPAGSTESPSGPITPAPTVAPPQGASSPSPAPAGSTESPSPATAYAPAANGPSGDSTTEGSPGSSTAGNAVSPPPPRSFAVSPCDPSFVLLSAVSLLFSFGLIN